MTDSGDAGDVGNRLRWQCRRGMLELDLLLARFLETGFEELDADGRADLERLLGYPDQVLHDWLMDQSVPADPRLARLVERIQQATKSPIL